MMTTNKLMKLKKLFKLKTFIHDLYKKLTNNEDEKDLDDN